MEDSYDKLRGDGSYGQLENINVENPVDGTTYSGSIIQYSYGMAVPYMIIFSGLDSDGNAVVWDYMLGTIDAEVNPI